MFGVCFLEGSKTFQPPLAPIPVCGPFHCVVVDILQLPLKAQGNCYVAISMDYLAIPDQKVRTIGREFVENIVRWHRIPEELMSEHGSYFLSTLINEVCPLLGVQKMNASSYKTCTCTILQTDRMVESQLYSHQHDIEVMRCERCVQGVGLRLYTRVPLVPALWKRCSDPYSNTSLSCLARMLWTLMTTRKTWFSACQWHGNWQLKISRRLRLFRRSTW